MTAVQGDLVFFGGEHPLSIAAVGEEDNVDDENSSHDAAAPASSSATLEGLQTVTTLSEVHAITVGIGGPSGRVLPFTTAAVSSSSSSFALARNNSDSVPTLAQLAARWLAVVPLPLGQRQGSTLQTRLTLCGTALECFRSALQRSKAVVGLGANNTGDDALPSSASSLYISHPLSMQSLLQYASFEDRADTLEQLMASARVGEGGGGASVVNTVVSSGRRRVNPYPNPLLLKAHVPSRVPAPTPHHSLPPTAAALVSYESFGCTCTCCGVI